jgi:hypothetical protein
MVLSRRGGEEWRWNAMKELLRKGTGWKKGR